MVQHFLENGFNEIDTAFMYCDGKTEELLGEMGPAMLEKLIIATKANPFGPGGMCSMRAYAND